MERRKRNDGRTNADRRYGKKALERFVLPAAVAFSFRLDVSLLSKPLGLLLDIIIIIMSLDGRVEGGWLGAVG